MARERYMRRCLKLARAALAQGDVPVGAVIVDGDRIVGEGSECTRRGSEWLRRSARRPGSVPGQAVGGPHRPHALRPFMPARAPVSETEVRLSTI